MLKDHKELLHLKCGLMTFDVTTWRSALRANLILVCEEHQGDGDLIAVCSAFSRTLKITIGRSGFFNNGKHAWAKFDFRLR